MKNSFLTITVILLYSLTAKSQAPTLNEVGGFENPESVAAHGKYLYVSNMGPKLEPMAKDGDGFISKLARRDGKVVEQKFYTGLNSPKGVYIHCGTMYVADVDKVVAVCLKTKKKLWEADFSKLGVNYLNDITRAGCGSIFVSATDKNAVYVVCKKGTHIKQLQVKGVIDGANGLYRSCGKLYIANYGHDKQSDGSFGFICLASKKYTTYGNGGIYDGIQHVCGKLIVSDWGSITNDKGRILVFKTCHKKMVEINLGRSINGPSDIYRDCRTHLLWIPAMREGKIISVPMKQVRMLACEKKK